MDNEVVYQEDELIFFEDGLFGFEEYKKFLPLYVEENTDATLYLQSVEDSALSFIVMNPFMLSESYRPVLAKSDMDKLEGTEEDLSYYVICVVKDSAEESSVNLKCPIVVNSVTRKARQVILESQEYQFRHSLKEFVKEGDGVC